MTGTMHATLAEWGNGISLRTKITGVTVLVMTLGLVVSGIGVMSVLRTYLISDSDAQIAATLRGVTAQTIARDEAAGATQFVLAHLQRDGTVIQENPTWRELDPSAAEVRRGIESSGGGAFPVRNDTGAPAYRL